MTLTFCETTTTSEMATTGIGFRWLDLLEKEFDKACVELDTSLSELENDEPEVVCGARQKIATLGSCFAQLTHKALSIFQNSAKLEAELVDMRAELVQARAASIEANDGDSVSSVSEAVRARAEASQLAKENAALRETILALHSELFGARLATKYLDKELAGRIQQLQLLGKDMRSELRDSLWAQVEAEILLQRHKTLVRVCRGASASGGAAGSGGRALPPPRPRNVRLRRAPHLGLGISVTGGREHGVPILISELEAGGPAALTGELFVGDAILAINEIDLTQACHKEAVQALQSVKGDCVLCVQFIATDDDDRLSEDNYRFPLYAKEGEVFCSEADGGGATPTAPRTPDYKQRADSPSESGSECAPRAPCGPLAPYQLSDYNLLNNNMPILDMDDDSIKIEARLEMVSAEVPASPRPRSDSESASCGSTPVHAARKRLPLDWRTKGAYRAVAGTPQSPDHSPRHTHNHAHESPPTPIKEPPPLVDLEPAPAPPPIQSIDTNKLTAVISRDQSKVVNGTKPRRENKGFRIGSARRITGPQLPPLSNGDKFTPLLHGDGDPDFGTPV